MFTVLVSQVILSGRQSVRGKVELVVMALLNLFVGLVTSYFGDQVASS